MNSYLVQTFEEDGTTIKSEKVYKNIQQISKDLNIPYHNVRALTLYNNDLKTPKFKHDNTKLLEKSIRITKQARKINL